MFINGLVKTAAVPMLKAPNLGTPKVHPLGQVQIPKPSAPTLAAPKLAAAQKFTGGFKNMFTAHHTHSDSKPSTPEMKMAPRVPDGPLGASMPNQGTGGGIAGN
jgi:hypothetical protein